MKQRRQFRVRSGIDVPGLRRSKNQIGGGGFSAPRRQRAIQRFGDVDRGALRRIANLMAAGKTVGALAGVEMSLSLAGVDCEASGVLAAMTYLRRLRRPRRRSAPPPPPK
jgi:hypothetical protein